MERAVLIAALGLAATANDTDITTAIATLKTEAGRAPGLANEKATLTDQKSGAETALANEKSAHTTTKTTLANVMEQRNKLALANAIGAGRITPAEQADWNSKLSADWETNGPLLEKKAKSMKTEGVTEGMGGRRPTGLANEATSKFTAAVQARVAGTKESWTACWNAVKAEQPALFAQMNEAEAN